MAIIKAVAVFCCKSRIRMWDFGELFFKKVV